jgi:hypothetical protein
MNVGMKSTAELIDSLITTSIKCFLKQDILMSSPEDKVVQVAKDIQTLNKRRNELMIEIDKRLGDSDITVTDKTY